MAAEAMTDHATRLACMAKLARNTAQRHDLQAAFDQAARDFEALRVATDEALAALRDEADEHLDTLADIEFLSMPVRITP